MEFQKTMMIKYKFQQRAIRRLHKDLESIKELSCPDYKVVDHREIFRWTVLVKGPAGSAHADIWIPIYMVFEIDYPSVAPKIRMKHDVFHPNLHSVYKEFSARNLCSMWNPAYHAHDAIVFVIEALGVCWKGMVWNSRAYWMFWDKEKYKEEVMRLVEPHFYRRDGVKTNCLMW